MKSLASSETELVGRWETVQGRMTADETAQRIEWLVEHELSHVGSDDSGWNNLYRDPSTGRYWELTYPQSEMHGGGPPKLACLDEEEARKKYELR